VRGRKEDGNTMLAGLYFVSPVEIQGFGSGAFSRLLGWIVGKISLSSLYPAPVSLLGLGAQEPPLAPLRPP